MQVREARTTRNTGSIWSDSMRQVQEGSQLEGIGMKPPEIKYLVGNALEVLKTLPDGLVQTVATSPPYWSLRDYDSPMTIWGGKEGCNHKWGKNLKIHQGGKNGSSAVMEGRDQSARNAVRDRKAGQFCRSCGAWKGALGLEPTPELYVEHIVEIFREIKRVLRKDGTVWLNLGDCYAGSGGMGSFISRKQKKGLKVMDNYHRSKTIEGVKPKDLVGIPWRVAFGLQADGWYLRRDIIWFKPNVMPESVTDRPTSSHEYIFLLSLEPDYYYDSEAIKEPCITPMTDKSSHTLGAIGGKMAQLGSDRLKGKDWIKSPTRNKRSVWIITTRPYSKSHFATFPEDLIIPCIKAGSSEKGCCPKCGAPYRRVMERPNMARRPTRKNAKQDGKRIHSGFDGYPQSAGQDYQNWRNEHPNKTVGWRPSCTCNVGEPVPCTILDPFAGSGTSLMVARKLGRSSIGIDIQAQYRKLASTRAEVDTPPLDNFGGDEDEQIHDRDGEEGKANGN